jgi:hypothetical protein
MRPNNTLAFQPLQKSSGERIIMTLGAILLIILVLALLGAVPAWPHSRSWGYAPGGIIGAILIIVVLLMLLGRI